MIPLAIRSEEGVLGLLPRPSISQLSRADRAAIKSFLSAYADAKVLVVTDTPGDISMEALNDRILVAPVTAVL